jgi:O-antigen/teichoic acid export membrane protein
MLTFPLSLITGLIGTVLFPSLNKLKASEEAVRSEYLFILKLIGFISFPVAFILLLFSDKLVFLLWGEAWMGVAQLLPYFGLLVLSQSLLSTIGNILVLMKREEVLRISGWISAAVIIAGIVYGASVSLLAIAQFYSLVFIAVVLPYHLFFVYIKVLKFSARSIILFWGSNILFSLAIWFTCFYNLELVRIILLILFLMVMMINARTEIGRTIMLINNNLKLYKR